MPPKRKSKTNAHTIPQPAASDYDTDTANYTDSANIALPAPPVRSNEELNMLVLRRWVPDIHSILAIAPFAVLYIFSPETQAWEKCETQGSLFICQLQSHHNSPVPRYRVIILNRKNPENWVYDVTEEESIQVTEEYVIVQKMDENGGELIYGIWIFSDGESNTRELIAATVLECARTAAQFAGLEDEEQDEEEVYEQRGHAERHYEQSIQQPHGQSIDIATLFAKPAQQQQQKQQQSMPPQQNTLLDLFNNAKQG